MAHVSKAPSATTVADYMAGYQGTIEFGMPTWVVPLSVYPTTYNRRPLGYVSLAAQKSHYALYVTCAYADPAEDAWLRDAFARAGKKLDMGKSCLRFKRVDDLPLDVVGEFIARVTPARFVELYERARAR